MQDWGDDEDTQDGYRYAAASTDSEDPGPSGAPVAAQRGAAKRGRSYGQELGGQAMARSNSMHGTCP